MDALRTAVPVALALFAAGYALWVARWFLRGQRTAGTKQASPPKAEARPAIIGKKPLYDATSKPSDANRCHRFGKRKRGRKSRYICRSKCA